MKVIIYMSNPENASWTPPKPQNAGKGPKRIKMWPKIRKIKKWKNKESYKMKLSVFMNSIRIWTEIWRGIRNRI